LQFDRHFIAILEQIETLAHKTILMIAKGSFESVTRKKRNNAMTKEKDTK
jgi:hypothetical protein